ncbi:MAG: tRNA uridine-5-carboxymethylaminomethyl(34) synthesis GTPase MnmE [Candidatus Omnitrophota bacterium]
MGKRGLQHNADDTIVAISTPVGEGGIGIVRLSGRQALSIADRIFASKDGSKPSAYKTHTTHYGYIVKNRLSRTVLLRQACLPAGKEVLRRTSTPPSANIIDEVILTVMRAPKTYTKEDVVEINCHGGVVCLKRVLDLALNLGARLADPGEFTKRAFMNGRIDLTQAEAVLDIIRARTDLSMKLSMRQLEGGLSKRIKAIKERLVDILSGLEAEIDFSEEEIVAGSERRAEDLLTDVSKEIEALIKGSRKGMILKEGIMCVICGRPNAGKSSLMNAFLRRNRVIVTPMPGTTRDAIEEEVNLGDVPVRIVDTAGISHGKNIAEKHGISKSRSYMKMADIIIFMLDLGRRWSKVDGEILNSIKDKNFIVVANKSDLKRRLDLKRLRKLTGNSEVIEISLLRKTNLDSVEKLILQKVWDGEILQPEGHFVTSLRQKGRLSSAQKSIKASLKGLSGRADVSPEITASDIREAIFHIGSILGDSADPDVLDRIFSKFCIGK